MKGDRPLRFAELFAGAGGLSLGLERAGWSCVWHAEIAEQPRAILRHRWPDVPLYGDVLELDGRALTASHGAIDLLTGGSPCQDLSVAGKRAGLSGDRSSLFFQQMRLWDETGADLCLWENVDGARSSNAGKDFGAVLSAFVGGTVPVPRDGWRSAGVAAGPGGVAAWRVLDAQFFGVPQRRRRVFVLGTRTGSVDPAEVLSLAEGVRGDFAESREAREGTAADARVGAKESRRLTIAFKSGQSEAAGATFVTEEFAPTLQAQNNGSTAVPAILAIDGEGNDTDDTFGCLNAHHSSYNRGAVVSFDWSKGNDVNNPRPSTLNVRVERTDPLRASTVPAVCLFDTTQITHPENRSNPQPGDPCHPLAAGAHAPLVVPTLNAGCGELNGQDAMNGALIVDAPEIAPTLNGSQRMQVDGAMTATAGFPRRLTPLECERLQGWEDNWTLVPDAKGKPLSDAARYKACGNGVAAVHSHWIGWRLALALNG